MNFEELDGKMRIYEQSIDQCILPDMYMIARLDGRGFTSLTKEICKFEAPFDEKFRDMMVEAVKSLMECGFRIIYGFTESDEISLLFHPEEKCSEEKCANIIPFWPVRPVPHFPCSWGIWRYLTVEWFRFRPLRECRTIFFGGRRMPTEIP